MEAYCPAGRSQRFSHTEHLSVRSSSHHESSTTPLRKALPGDVESLSAALPVAGHAGSAGRLALPAVVLADVAGLVGEQSEVSQESFEKTKDSCGQAEHL